MTRVGYRDGHFDDLNRPHWREDSPRPLVWNVWYPAAEESVAEDIPVGPPGAPIFLLDALAQDAAPAPGRHPVVLLSHGTGGSAVGLHWLARHLAAEGFIVLGANHHGNTAREPYLPEGFLAWWERSRDLSLLLDLMASEGPLAGSLDLDRVFAVGFSLGGHAVLGLLGARTDMEQFRAWALAQPAELEVSRRGPREFPDLDQHVDSLLATSARFKESWTRQLDDYGDPRIRAACLLAPAPTIRGLTEASVRAIDRPLKIMVGDADIEAPPPLSHWLKERLPHSELTILGPDIGHYVFLQDATPRGRTGMPEIFIDPPGVDRLAVQREVAAAVAGFLGRQGR
ncbi:alpha/beta hydrolase family protein [Lacibacterium aquatile]|uniref:Alpha/beta hydrolase family protein n=1 Tax=Lacibacterium aquatile TaxID=1168082 RepID=A0ABW5DSQ5_9PROT